MMPPAGAPDTPEEEILRDLRAAAAVACSSIRRIHTRANGDPHVMQLARFALAPAVHMSTSLRAALLHTIARHGAQPTRLADIESRVAAFAATPNANTQEPLPGNATRAAPEEPLGPEPTAAATPGAPTDEGLDDSSSGTSDEFAETEDEITIREEHYGGINPNYDLDAEDVADEMRPRWVAMLIEFGSPSHDVSYYQPPQGWDIHTTNTAKQNTVGIIFRSALRSVSRRPAILHHPYCVRSQDRHGVYTHSVFLVSPDAAVRSGFRLPARGTCCDTFWQSWARNRRLQHRY